MRGLVSLQIAEIELTIQARHKKFNGPSFWVVLVYITFLLLLYLHYSLCATLNLTRTHLGLFYSY
jgi:hypothetical protein